MRSGRVVRWVVLASAGALVLGTVSLARGSSGAGSDGRAARAVVEHAGPLPLTDAQQAVLWVSNVSPEAHAVGMKLFDQNGTLLAHARPTIPSGESRNIIGVLIGLRPPDAKRGPATGAVRARIAFTGGDPGRPVVVGSLYVQDSASGPSRFVDGTSNTVLFGEAFTRMVHTTEGATATAMVTNVSDTLSAFRVVALDADGTALAKKTLRGVAPGATAAMGDAMGDGSVRFVVDGLSGTPFLARVAFANESYILPYVEQQA